MPRAPNKRKREQEREEMHEMRARVLKTLAAPFIKEAREEELSVPKQYRVTCALAKGMQFYRDYVAAKRAASGRST